MKKRTSFDMEIGGSIDLSLLRRPLTPFTGFQEAKSAFEKGTAEVRHLLLHECSLIYECNICRNMFRSLANFISHKRVFCCKSALAGNDSHDSTGNTETRKSSAAREYLPPKNTAELHRKHREQVVVNEDDVAATASVATKKADLPNVKNKPGEIKAGRGDTLTDGTEHKKHVADQNASSSQQLSVERNSDRSSTSYVFQCPSCSLTFLKSSSVIRHLALSHNIPMRRIRMLRDTIIKRPAETVVLNGDETLSEPKHEIGLKSLPVAAAESSSCSAATENSNDQLMDEDLTKCIFCQQSFEQRATLAAHLQTCHIKIELLEEPTKPTKSPTPDNKRMRLHSNASLLHEKAATASAALAADVDYAMIENDDVKRTFAHLEQQDFGGGLQTVSLDELDISAGESTNASVVVEKEVKVETNTEAAKEPLQLATKELENADSTTVVAAPAENVETVENVVVADAATSPSSSSTKKRKIRTNCVAKQSCRCKICGKQFNALSNLRRHISMFHYRSRKFGCALCDYCAFRRYDIVNHLSFVHKLSGEDNGETAKLVRVNDVHYTKDDMDEDIVLLGAATATRTDDSSKNEEDENLTANNFEPLTTTEPEHLPEKRRRRRNKTLVSQVVQQLEAKPIVDVVDSSTVEVKLTRQTLKRSLSSNSAGESVHSTTKVNQKRPTRNRVKPVNKDFVYDLNDVLKKEQTQAATPQTPVVAVENETYHLRGSKRRNTLNSGTMESKLPFVAPFEYLKPKAYATIKGAARRSCLLMVNMGLAASSTLPEIPSERPQMRTRLVSLQRSDSQAAPVIIDSTELDAERLMSLPLCDDTYLEKIAKESVGSFQMKPCLAQQHSALDTLLQKVDFTKNLFNGANMRNQLSNELHETVAQTNCLEPTGTATAYEHNRDTVLSTNTVLSPCYITPEQTLPKSFVTPSKPQKRLPSLDRLTETIFAASESYYNAPTLEQ